MVLAPFFWFLLIYVFTSALGLATSNSAYLIWAVTSLGLLFATLIVLWGESRKFAGTVEVIQDRYRLVIANIEKDVRRYLDTSIVFKKSRHEMRELLLPDLVDFSKSSDPEIVILGADQLRPSTDQFSKFQIKSAAGQITDREEETEYEYGVIFNEILARSSDKLLKRFIYLFRAKDLEGRTKEFQESYLNWLTDQVQFFLINQNYTIIDTPRATVWGAPKSIIFFRNINAEVFFKGGGIVMTSRSNTYDSVVSATRRSLIDDYVNNKQDGPTRTEYRQINLGEFQKYIDEIRTEVRKGSKV
jgi:hypothetical protein